MDYQTFFRNTNKESKGRRLMICTNLFDRCIELPSNNMKSFDDKVNYCEKKFEVCLRNYEIMDKRQ